MRLIFREPKATCELPGCERTFPAGTSRRYCTGTHKGLHAKQIHQARVEAKDHSLWERAVARLAQT